MDFRVFISHSVAPIELGIVYAIANESAKRGASPFIPDRDWEVKGDIPERIFPYLRDAHYLLAIATSSGFQLQWLNREVREGLKMGKPILIIADRGIKIPQKIDLIRIDRANPARTISEASKYLEKFGKDKQTKELLTWLGIGSLLFLLLRGREE